MRAKHTDACLQEIAKLERVEAGSLTEALQKVGYLLSYESCVIDHPDAFVQLALQVACDFIPRPNQREILQQMFNNGELQDQFKQVLQADGKTYVLGPYLALLNADGEHLSVHVDPKYQYETTLSTLGSQIQKTINKMICRFEYDDSESHYASAHLAPLYTHLLAAVEEKRPVVTTQDDLRAFRSRYIESAIRLHNNPIVSMQLKSTMQ